MNAEEREINGMYEKLKRAIVASEDAELASRGAYYAKHTVERAIIYLVFGGLHEVEFIINYDTGPRRAVLMSVEMGHRNSVIEYREFSRRGKPYKLTTKCFDFDEFMGYAKPIK